MRQDLRLANGRVAGGFGGFPSPPTPLCPRQKKTLQSISSASLFSALFNICSYFLRKINLIQLGYLYEASASASSCLPEKNIKSRVNFLHLNICPVPCVYYSLVQTKFSIRFALIYVALISHDSIGKTIA